MMFKYTIESVRSIVDEIKLWGKIFKYMSLIFTSAYFIYVLIMGIGNVYANAVLTGLFVCYTLFEIITAKKNWKKARSAVRHTYAWVKIAIKTFTLGAAVYGIYTAATNEVKAFDVILITLMIILWVLQVLLEIISGVVESKIDLVSQAIKQDVDDIKQTVAAPITVVSNAIRRLRGEEPVEKPKSKKILFLEKKIEKRKTLKAKQKEEERLAQHEQREELRLARKQQKQELKNAKAQQKQELRITRIQQKEEIKALTEQMRRIKEKVSSEDKRAE